MEEKLAVLQEYSWPVGPMSISSVPSMNRYPLLESAANAFINFATTSGAVAVGFEETITISVVTALFGQNSKKHPKAKVKAVKGRQM